MDKNAAMAQEAALAFLKITDAGDFERAAKIVQEGAGGMWPMQAPQWQASVEERKGRGQLTNRQMVRIFSQPHLTLVTFESDPEHAGMDSRRNPAPVFTEGVSVQISATGVAAISGYGAGSIHTSLRIPGASTAPTGVATPTAAAAEFALKFFGMLDAGQFEILRLH